MSGTSGRLAQPFPQRMLIPFVISGSILPCGLAGSAERTAAINIDLVQRARVNPTSSLYAQDQVIRTRGLSVVVKRNGQAVFRLDQRGVHVALRECSLGARVLGSECLSGIQIWSARFAAHRIQVREAVSAIDVHPPRRRADCMGWVVIPVALQRVHRTPCQNRHLW